jgi:hypothetical protein
MKFNFILSLSVFAITSVSTLETRELTKKLWMLEKSSCIANKNTKTAYEKIKSLLKCRDLCLEVDDCTGAFYNKQLSYCETYKGSVEIRGGQKDFKYCGTVAVKGTGPSGPSGPSPTPNTITVVKLQSSMKCMGEAGDVTKNVKTATACVELCKSSNKCDGVEYHRANDTCTFYSGDITMEKSVKAKSCGLKEVKPITKSPTKAPTVSPTRTHGPTKDVTTNLDNRFNIKYHATCGALDMKKGKLHENISSLRTCIWRCDKTPGCKSFYYTRFNQRCYLLFYKVKTMPSVDPSDKLRVCGKVDNTAAPTLPPQPTVSPTKAVVTKNTWDYKYDTYCDDAIDWNEAEKFDTFTTFKQCILKCDTTANCKSFYWNGKKASCIIMKYKVKLIKKSEDLTKKEVCGKLLERFVTQPPSPSPTKTQCVIQADLGHPYTNPDQAEYKGYHADWLEVTREKEAGLCSYASQGKSWCKYSISDPEGDSAYLANWDDDYYPEGDFLSKEKIIITGVENDTVTFLVQHYFFSDDYYYDDDTWKGYMMPAVLKLKNLTKKSDIGNSAGWAHPVSLNVPAKINGQENSKYKGNFEVTVTCNGNCGCTGEYILVQ